MDTLIILFMQVLIYLLLKIEIIKHGHRFEKE